MKKKKDFIKIIVSGFFIVIAMLLSTISPVSASQFSLSPMYQFITLTPGEKYVGNFEIVNPGSSKYDFYYKLRVEPFSVDNSDDISLTSSNGDYNRITDWISFSEEEGIISPNKSKEVRFTIDVPTNAPAGGQYASVVISSGAHRVDNSMVDLREIYESAHLIYAEVAGETVRKGSLNDVNVPSFLFSGNISGSALIKNEGNVHSQATSTLQIFPLFSNEEVFTNEENPKKSWIMPGNTTLTTTDWTETPSMGIFHVIYNVEFEGVNQKVDKMVIVCPLWLLFVILVLIFLIIFKILSGKREKK